MELKCWGRLADSPFVGFASQREVENDFEQTWRVVMKSIGGLMVGSMAGMLVAGGAHAADLPLKAKTVEYVRVCSLYGAGFWYIPGTDTCIKLGGYLRVDTTINGSGLQNNPAWSGDSGQGNRFRDYFTGRARMSLTVDTRTATEYGVVRTFGGADFQFDTLGAATVNPAVLNSSFNSTLLYTPGGGYVAVEYVLIQFAGFTFGKSASAFATPWQGYPGNNSSFLLGGHDSVTGVNNVQYTAEFGSGVTGTIGLNDPTVYNRTSIFDLATTGGLSAVGTMSSAYGGIYSPDIVGNIRVDQAWGLFQVSAAAHEVDASYNVLGAGAAPTALSEISGHPSTKWGGAVMTALQIRNIPTGPGDDFKIDASFAKGDTKNVIASSAASPSFAIFGGSGHAYQSIAFGATTDAVYLPSASGGDGALHLTEAFGVRGAFNHNWDPYWSSALFGSASWVRNDAGAKSAYCATYIASNKLTASNTSADFSCNPNYAVYQLGLITRWTPVKNLTFSAEAMYSFLDQNFTGTATLTPSAPMPTAVYEYKDQGTLSFNVRVQRNF